MQTGRASSSCLIDHRRLAVRAAGIVHPSQATGAAGRGGCTLGKCGRDDLAAARATSYSGAENQRPRLTRFVSRSTHVEWTSELRSKGGARGASTRATAGAVTQRSGHTGYWFLAGARLR